MLCHSCHDPEKGQVVHVGHLPSGEALAEQRPWTMQNLPFPWRAAGEFHCPFGMLPGLRRALMCISQSRKLPYESVMSQKLLAINTAYVEPSGRWRDDSPPSPETEAELLEWIMDGADELRSATQQLREVQCPHHYWLRTCLAFSS